MIKQFFSWLINFFKSKPKELYNKQAPKAAPVEKQKTIPVERKPKIHTLAFRKQQLTGKVFVTQTHMIHLTKFLGIKFDKFIYQVTYKKLI